MRRWTAALLALAEAVFARGVAEPPVGNVLGRSFSDCPQGLGTGRKVVGVALAHPGRPDVDIRLVLASCGGGGVPNGQILSGDG